MKKKSNRKEKQEKKRKNLFAKCYYIFESVNTFYNRKKYTNSPLFFLQRKKKTNLNNKNDHLIETLSIARIKWKVQTFENCFIGPQMQTHSNHLCELRVLIAREKKKSVDHKQTNKQRNTTRRKMIPHQLKGIIWKNVSNKALNAQHFITRLKSPVIFFSPSKKKRNKTQSSFAKSLVIFEISLRK